MTRKEFETFDIRCLSEKAQKVFEESDHGLYDMIKDCNTAKEINEVLEELADEKAVRWYAVQEKSDDAWDYGSYVYEEAVKMLKEQGCGQIAVVNEQTLFCEKEIRYEDLI